MSQGLEISLQKHTCTPILGVHVGTPLPSTNSVSALICYTHPCPSGAAIPTFL